MYSLPLIIKYVISVNWYQLDSLSINERYPPRIILLSICHGALVALFRTHPTFRRQRPLHHEIQQYFTPLYDRFGGVVEDCTRTPTSHSQGIGSYLYTDVYTLPLWLNHRVKTCYLLRWLVKCDTFFLNRSISHVGYPTSRPQYTVPHDRQLAGRTCARVLLPGPHVLSMTDDRRSDTCWNHVPTTQPFNPPVGCSSLLPPM